MPIDNRVSAIGWVSTSGNDVACSSRLMGGTASHYLDSRFKNGATNLGDFALTN